VLEVELDIFSGMPNPAWALSEAREKTLLELLRSDRGQVSPARTASGRLGLGYRGMVVRRSKQDSGVWDKAMAAARKPFPDEFRLGVNPARRDSAAEWLLSTAGPQGAGVDDELLEVASRGVQLVPRTRGPRDPSARIDRREAEAGVPADLGSTDGPTSWYCPSDHYLANADFFNEPAHIARNNCYCFASNHRADVRYALPGERGGRPALFPPTCGHVIDGLRADGWTDACQLRTLTIALVIWPGRDYHFYRLVSGGPYWWWGHKPGGTRATYSDDCGAPIFQWHTVYTPENICRGDYEDFCGYFYQDNTTAYVA
jgi:hypothetical protein